MSTKFLNRLIACFVLTCLSNTIGAVGFSNMTPERLWDLARIGSPAPSPDGKSVVFTVGTYARGATTPRVDLWLMDSEGDNLPRQLTRNLYPDLDPAWSPDSSRIVYASVRGDKPARPYLLNLRGGEPQQLARFPTAVANPRFRPGFDTVIFEADTFADVNADIDRLQIRLAAKERLTEHGFASEARLAFRNGSPQVADRVTHLFEVDIESGEIRDLMPQFESSPPLTSFDWDLSYDGRYAVVSALRSKPPFNNLDQTLYLIDLESLQRQEITANLSGSAFRPRFTDNQTIIYGRTRIPDSLSENTELFRYDMVRSQHSPISDAQRHSPLDWVASNDGKQLYYSAEEAGRVNIYRSGINGGRARVLYQGGNARAIAVGPEGHLFFLDQSFFQPPTIRRTDSNGNHPRELTLMNQPLLENTRRGTVRDFSFSGADGDTIHGFLMLPPGFNESRRWPIILLLHGGPHAAWLDSFYFRWNLLTLAAPGYIVAAINPHGSTGFGQDFASAIRGDPVSAPLADARASIDALSEIRFVDRERLAVVGGSYGGYLAYWLTARDPRVDTAVIHAGVFDLLLQYGSDYPWGRHLTYGARPWEDSDRYAQLSPSSVAKDLTRPMLLLHGMLDTRVPPQHAVMVHNIQTARGIPSRIVLFPNQGHQINQRDAAERWWREIHGWLAEKVPAGPK